MFSSRVFVVGGGVSKHHGQTLPLLRLQTPIVPATLLNNVHGMGGMGVMGAAALAHR